ncbi:hypothetical protein ASPZODRAFT_153355 [Penicilliopsis zonata CBS 506.65]|uniref:Zn(2)-C6 fungal-type domain-containing protein n=1 Tax=Penicilliopsis zonata CBS 506.65 TaxID=1073090 RepID=A0A1L9SCW6_9EURO|nr:hypothetical protein ASPZODRAFT_153355 [Penicilliopsis zonata CBS 506.65]OJJ45055.1 hypothetical protein ASPZODRAFT_153355 [Penicilliopsis zonata CBS 506.65]
MERRLGLGHSSVYGQACMQCYKAKCRCVPGPSGDGCERCLRLKKECRPSDSARRRNAQRAEESDTRIARLEDKIGTLVSAIQSLVDSSGSSSPELLQLLNQESVSSIASLPSTTTLSDDRPTTTTSFVDPSSKEAAESLEFFRSRMLPCFPFINLRPETTAWGLHRDRPFLLQAILTVTTFSTQKRLALIEELKRTFFASACLTVQSNIDLLLGLLTYLAWSTDAFLGGADLVSRLMMLAISLVYDLRLFKPSPPDVKLLMTITQGRAYDEQTGEETVQELMEKQRALLAAFLLSSNISSHLGRLDALRWTPQMEEALRVIGANKTCPTDEAFAFQVRLQLLKQRAAYIREQHDTAVAPVTTSVPGLLYLKTLQGQLHDLVSSFPSNLHQRDILVMHAHYVELYINQLAYSISRDSPLLNLSGQRSDGGLLPGIERLECLWQSVECIKAWLDKFYQIAPRDLVGLPFHFWSQMILAITLLKYLSILEDPAWDCSTVRNAVDLISTMDCMVQKLDLTAREEPGLHCTDSLFNLLSKLLTRFRLWADAHWNLQEHTAQGDVQGQSTSASSYIPDVDQLVWIQSMDLESDTWFQDIWPTNHT